MSLSHETVSMLTELADLLDRLPDDRFDYNVWVGWDWKGAEDLSCGTTACAGGWAATLPSFRAKGLTLKGLRDEDSYQLLADALDISMDDAEFLFTPGVEDPSFDPDDSAVPVSPEYSASAGDVAAHIRAYVKNRA